MWFGDFLLDPINGAIVATGFTAARAGQFSADENDFVVARYLANGTLDTTFDPVPPGGLPSVPGTRRIDFGFQTDIAEAVAIQVDRQLADRAGLVDPVIRPRPAAASARTRHRFRISLAAARVVRFG